MRRLATPVPYGLFNPDGTVKHNVRVCALTGTPLPQGGVLLRVNGTPAFFRLTGNARRKISNLELHTIRENIRAQLVEVDQAEVPLEATSLDAVPDLDLDLAQAEEPRFTLVLAAEDFAWFQEAIQFFRLSLAEDVLHEIYPKGRGQKAVLDWLEKNPHSGEQPVNRASCETQFTFTPGQPVSTEDIKVFLEQGLEPQDADDPD